MTHDNARRKAAQFAPAFVAALAAIAICAHALAPADPLKTMAAAARDFAASLGEEQRKKALYPFDADERMNWHYFPKVRGGLPFGEMSPAQSALAHALIASGLAGKGQMKAFQIVSLEDVLREAEGRAGNEKSASTRRAEAYYVAIFGEPSEEKDWGWRLEGHHLSLNFTIVGGKLAVSTPLFMGANPHEIPEGPRKGLRPLAAEEDLARDLLASLDDAQRKRAIIDEKAPQDVFTRADRKAQLEGPPQGLPRSEMNEAQQGKLRAIIEEYAAALAPALADSRLAKIAGYAPGQAAQIHFAWMGGTEKGQPHYYRVQGPTFVIEYDNIQNNANHSHTVWRDFEGDFGLDLLAEHHKAAHGEAKAK